MVSYLVVALLAIVLTVILQRTIARGVVLVFVTALITATAFQVIAYLDLKYQDPFFVIAFLSSSLLAGVVSALTLIVLRNIGSRDPVSKQNSD